MAKKAFLKDSNSNEILPITRGELVLDSSGKQALHSNEFLATDTQPGLMSKEDKKQIDQLKTQSIPYIKGPTTDAKGTWTGTYSGITAYTEGLTIIYVPGVAGASTTTLNINGLGAKTCYYSGSTKMTTHYPAGTPILLTYTNGGWGRADYTDGNTYTSAFCTTAAATAAKAASCSNFTLTAKTYVHVLFIYANSAASAITLNINSTGAKPIYINGSASSTTNYTLPAGTYLVYYNGTNYYLRTDGILPGTIETTSEASKVANKLILKLNTGTTEGTNLYTYDGSAVKTLDIKSGTGIDFTTSAGNLSIKNTGVLSVSTGDNNGTIKVNTNGTSANIAVKGLGSAAYTNSSNYVTITGNQTVTGAKTFTNVLKIQNGSASGAFVFGADVNALTLTENTRKLGRMGVPSYDSTTKTVAGISFDSQVNANYVDFGGHPQNTSSIAPDVIRFVVADKHDNAVTGTRTLALQISKQSGLSDTSAGGTSVAAAKFFIPVQAVGTIHAGDTITSDKGFIGNLTGNATSASDASKLGGQLPSYYATAESLKKYLPLAGGSMDNNASLKFCMYGNRYLTIDGNSITADMSNCNGGWAGAFASVKHKDPNSTAEDGTTVTTMLGWYGGATNLTHIFMGGTYSSPAMKMTPAGIFTFKNAIVGSITGEAGSVEWSNVKNKPTTFTPGDHTHATNKITASTGYSKATSVSAIAATDSLNTALGKLEYKADLGKTAYDWYKSVTNTDTDTLINKWSEIVGFLDSVAEGTDILDEFVTRKTSQVITGKKNFNTNTNASPLVISRTGGTTEAVSIGVNDSQAIFEYVNDEKSNAFVFKLINNDTESGDGSDANTNTVTFTGSSSGSTVAATTLQGRLAYTYLTGSGTTKDQAIVSSGTANGWTLKTLGSHAFDSTAYLPLAGGQMNSTAFISWNSGSGGNDLANWSITDNGLRIISSVVTTSKAPTQYATALHVKGRYGFQLATQGGDTSNAFFIKNVHNTTWNTLLHSNNYTTYVSTTNFPGLNKTGTVTSVTVKGANGLSGSGTVTTSGTITLSNAGVRSATISGDYLKVNTNGTDANLTIPYATAASYLKVTACRGGGNNSKLWDDPVVDAQKLKVWDVYNDEGPTTYGNILEINGIQSHWKPQLWFDSGTGQMRVRNRNYNKDEWGAWRIVLDSVNSSVSGGGSSWGSSITVKINGTEKTLTIPNNPNTDVSVTQSTTSTDKYRPVILGYTTSSTAGSSLDTTVTNQVYASNKFYACASTGALYATTFVGSLSGTATNSTQLGGIAASKYVTTDTAQTISGKKTFSNGLAITGGATENEQLQYFLGIDAFASGGSVRWITNTKVCNAIGAAKKANGIYYVEGTGSTAGTWLGTNAEITSYYTGLTIAYKIPVKGANTTTLNINNLGAVTIKRNADNLTTHVPVGSVIILVYDGTYFRWSDYDSNSYAYVRQYITDSTNEEYPLLFKYETSTTSTYVTKYTRFDSAITVNPSTNTITATSFKGNLIGTAANSDKLGGSAATDYLLKSDLATQELTSNLTTITKSLTVTAAWMDTGIEGANIPTSGTYIVQVYAHNSTDHLWYGYWSGVMSWYSSGTNDTDTDEIILHRSGHAYGNTIYLRTAMNSNGKLKLQIAANKTFTTAVNYTFKFKRII